jgi:hypothetical protein
MRRRAITGKHKGQALDQPSRIRQLDVEPELAWNFNRYPVPLANFAHFFSIDRRR